MSMRTIKGETDDYMIGGPGTRKKGKSAEVFPTVRLDLKNIPEAKKWKLGKEYTITLKTKLTGLSQSRFDNSAEFEIHGIDPNGEYEDDKDGDE